METKLFSDWLMKDVIMLNENYRQCDFLGRDEYVQQFSHELAGIPRWSIAWLLWSFWSGKSTFLNQLARVYPAKTYIFEAWKYPDRENLWTNFVYEIAKNIWVDKTKEVLQRIQNKDHNLVKSLLTDLMEYAHLSSFREFLYHNGKNQLDLIYEILKELLIELCSSKEKVMYLVIEDIDRSGDRGIFFIETLNYFLKKIVQEQQEAQTNIVKLKVIVPISNDNYEKDKQSYLKSLDFLYAFNPNKYDFSAFVRALFLDEISADRDFWRIFADFLSAIHDRYDKVFTIRQIKSILRAADASYTKIINSPLYNSEGLDYRIFLVTFFWRYLPTDDDWLIFNFWYSRGTQDSLLSATILRILEKDIQDRWARDLFVFQNHNDNRWWIQDFRHDMNSLYTFSISSRYLDWCRLANWGFFFI